MCEKKKKSQCRACMASFFKQGPNSANFSFLRVPQQRCRKHRIAIAVATAMAITATATATTTATSNMTHHQATNKTANKKTCHTSMWGGNSFRKGCVTWHSQPKDSQQMMFAQNLLGTTRILLPALAPAKNSRFRGSHVNLLVGKLQIRSDSLKTNAQSIQ